MEDIREKNDTIHKCDSLIEDFKSDLSLKTNELFETMLPLEAKKDTISLLGKRKSNMVDKITNQVLRKFKCQSPKPDVSEIISIWERYFIHNQLK